MQQTFSRDYVILLEDLEMGISKDQLNHITNLHKAGMEWEDISQEVKRDPYEVLVSLIHQAKRGHVLPPFRQKEGAGGLLVPGKELLKRETVTP